MEVSLILTFIFESMYGGQRGTDRRMDEWVGGWMGGNTVTEIVEEEKEGRKCFI